MKNSKLIASSFFAVLILVATFYYSSNYIANQNIKEKQEHLWNLFVQTKRKLAGSFKNSKKWPKEISVGEEKLKVEYTLNPKLEAYIKKVLKRYRSDYSTVVVIDNSTGGILAAVGYERDGNKFNLNLPFSSTHPSASLFKIITAAGLVDQSEVNKDTTFKYKGRGTTLYKYQLKDSKNRRWVRTQTFGKAFAYSNNVIFGKAAIKNLDGQGLFDLAQDFGFNQKLMEEIELSKSTFQKPRDDYNMAELASGFNKQTMISPIHAAVISSIVANDGTLNYPKLVKNIKNVEDNELVWSPSFGKRQVLDKESVDKLENLMRLTVTKGTARGGFRRFLRTKIGKKLLIGGKTGSITGGLPFGKRDWFTAFAYPKMSKYNKGISISVMNVNVDKWYIKSTHLAKNIIEYYYKNIYSDASWDDSRVTLR